jgi:hypothetical protein
MDSGATTCSTASPYFYNKMSIERNLKRVSARCGVYLFSRNYGISRKSKVSRTRYAIKEWHDQGLAKLVWPASTVNTSESVLIIA